ncbi:maturase [Mycobacterium tuberculosis]|uniref:reverse transcriptase domain-containing protein n=1 Tax=Mycobacterium tuberculosis TaxID=1773 RepID=UPI0005E8FCD3|nr:reverse transcriptase domain-containing protein [Mycobacterium tuberculosis]CKU93557.1 maturase [Mycobacterium tuberculosis]
MSSITVSVDPVDPVDPVDAVVAAGSDGLTVARIESEIGALEFLNELRTELKSGQFRPQPVRERKIPKPGGLGKVRRLGIPTVADRVVQAALKLVLEPIFETDFEPVSYGFRPARRAHDTIAEIHLFGTQEYRWVLDADIKACFDRIDHADLMDRVRHRIKDKRVLRLVNWQRIRHRWIGPDVRRWLTDPTGRWHPISADGITLFNPAAVPIRRYRYRGNTIPTPWTQAV